MVLVSQQDTVLTAVSAWEAQNLRALREQETRALQEQEQEQLLTYTREDAYSTVCVPHLMQHSTARALQDHGVVSPPVVQ